MTFQCLGNQTNAVGIPPIKKKKKRLLNVKLVQADVIGCSSVCRHTLPDVEVLHVDILVGSRLPLAPEQKTLLG